jgi:hypothetical protein
MRFGKYARIRGKRVRIKPLYRIYPPVLAKEGRGGNRYQLSKYCYDESDTLDVGTMETRKICEGIDAGNTWGGRNGSRIFLDYIQLQLVVVNPNASEVDAGWLRCAVLLNKFTASTNTTEMFDSVDDTRTPVNYSNAGKVQQLIYGFNTHKFDVIWDRKYMIKAQIAGDDKPHTLIVKVNIPIKRVFSMTTNVTADQCIIPDMDFIMFTERQDGAAAYTAALSYDYSLIHHFRSLD